MGWSFFRALTRLDRLEDTVSEEIRKSTRKRLETMLNDVSVGPARERTDWQDVELNFFDTGVQKSGCRGGDSVTDDAEAITSAAPLDRVGAVEAFPAEGEESNDVSLVEEMTKETDLPTLKADDPDHAGQPAAVAAFQAEVSEARQAAETQLMAVVERIRKEAADQHTAELARVGERHAEELRQARTNLEAEVTRHAAELARMREKLDDDLQQARSVVVESFKALTGSILKSA